jgi:hypothetical protein
VKVEAFILLHIIPMVKVDSKLAVKVQTRKHKGGQSKCSAVYFSKAGIGVGELDATLENLNFDGRKEFSENNGAFDRYP